MENFLKFNETVEVSGIYGINQFLNIHTDIIIGYEKLNAQVEYELIPDCRKYGLKCIDLQINKLSLTIEWYIEVEYLTALEKENVLKQCGKEENGLIIGTIEIDKSNPKWSIDSQLLEFKSDGGFHISDIELELSTKLITLS
jgi:hypothetical protein